MKLGIIGLPASGKSTVFRALTGSTHLGDRRAHDTSVGVVRVEDPRLDFLGDHHKPKKVTPVHVQYSDIAGITGEGKPGHSIGDKVLALIRPLDALVHCVRFFDSARAGTAEPLKDLRSAEEEMVLSDLATVEKRLERVERDFRKGKKELAEEMGLLKEAKSLLDEGKPLRYLPVVTESEKLRGFAFLSAKPELVLVNAGEMKRPQEIQQTAEQIRSELSGQPRIAVDWLYADTEAEIARLSPEEAREFLEELSLEEGAKERIIRTSLQLLSLIVFFTVSEPEVRAWALEKGKTALKAAGTVHTDMERGFIRAEVVAFDDFRQAGSMPAAHKAGKVRLEGRDYVVRDGDIIYFRFNV
ncbi:MAG: redox-regulated ATPase YchF [Deltaproteobacteria bacterium]|nr:redox-regulated ATPase YchF [Deltaproteobacteria bacterium]